MTSKTELESIKPFVVLRHFLVPIETSKCSSMNYTRFCDELGDEGFARCFFPPGAECHAGGVPKQR